jgi:hypothetical protein
MCVRRAWPKLHLVNATTLEIKLELELDGESVSGRATDAGGHTREFSGWIGLIGLVDSLLDGARVGADQTRTDHEENKDVA